MDNKTGKQTIGCEVTSCCYNHSGCECELNHIDVRPSCNCNSGEPNETMCGSYSCGCEK